GHAEFALLQRRRWCEGNPTLPASPVTGGIPAVPPDKKQVRISGPAGLLFTVFFFQSVEKFSNGRARLCGNSHVFGVSVVTIIYGAQEGQWFLSHTPPGFQNIKKAPAWKQGLRSEL